ncbi:bifunctional 2-polyprenyl-6-hydroxyphenol methylase/3-demethylubiquinol 3-O-methyltransferase UbiG [Phenylobacterium sp.]|uniref:class I SAM-dependent methyltransferase n=1 Tax=Phenylobacterium sp. TaxID=1871053 RepID=UPI002719A5A3|nr:class I SAM-dependent methyltransferase [Phenylobacterium sp.]MDO8800466.1 class I SAM-dependent methyltransferase [Phenylobacterium sp.]
MADEAHDLQTLAFYDREAEAYAGRRLPKASPRLIDFLAALPAGARVLDLGCGGGQDSEVMLAEGFEVTPLDGSAGLARIAQARLGRPVRVQLFEDLEDEASFDGVWANASLLHVPTAGLARVLARVRRALKPGGVFHASYKAGDGGGRDTLGRYFNFPSEAELRAAYGDAGPWAALAIRQGVGHSYEQEERTWLHVAVVRPA